ncbi:MAG TPA: hypothetical protein VE978_25500 [Chitinophagales bacterium]|nr:hypothetical protein [Chitinophagales bacterium]
MDKINIGFIGGCINHQGGINREDLYYSVLTRLLSGSHTEYQVSLGSYLSFNQLPNQAKIFLDTKQPNLIYLFIRPFPLMPLQKPIVKHETIKNKVAYSLHPALFTRQMIWKEELTKYESSTPLQFARKNFFDFRDINLLAGIVLGLHRWTLKYLTHQLELVNQLCTEQKNRLIIISPPQNPESLIANLTCKWTANYLEKYCKIAGLDFININSFSLTNFEQDKIHFNIQGHYNLGKLIYDHLKRQRTIAVSGALVL